jgi:hypothetical protein
MITVSGTTESMTIHRWNTTDGSTLSQLVIGPIKNQESTETSAALDAVRLSATDIVFGVHENLCRFNKDKNELVWCTSLEK